MGYNNDGQLIGINILLCGGCGLTSRALLLSEITSRVIGLATNENCTEEFDIDSNSFEFSFHRYLGLHSVMIVDDRLEKY